MVIKDIQVYHVPAGWRTWTFVRMETMGGIVGWSEVTDSHGSHHGIEGVIRDLAPLVIGENALNSEKIYWLLYSRTRQSHGSVVTKAIGGIENALLDIKGKFFNVPVYQLFGGALRDRIPLYWWHCGTTRVRAAEVCGVKPIKSFSDLLNFVYTVDDSDWLVVKTNIGAILDGDPHVYMPGFAKAVDGWPELNVDSLVFGDIENWIDAFRRFNGETILDLNYNFKTEGYVKVGKMLEEYNLLWLELDTYDPKACRYIRDKVNIPICTGENLYGLCQYRPFFENYSMDICSIDILWNGFVRSREIATVANLYEMNVTPHNYYSHLATFIAANWCACTPNLRMMEYDVDDVPWRDTLVTRLPAIANGEMHIPTGAGWGVDIDEEVLREHSAPRL